MKPSIGRIVHFVQNGVHYAALIVKVWSDTCVNLLVFPNGSDTITPGAVNAQNIATSVNHHTGLFSDGSPEWSWHWPETQFNRETGRVE